MKLSINSFLTAAHLINSLLRRHVVHVVQQLSHAPEPQASKEEEACCQSQGEPAPVWDLHTDQISVRAYGMLLARHLILVQSIQLVC